MARTVGSNGPKTMEAIRKAGLRLIYSQGYEAMSLRRLAAEVGIQAGSLYNHITTKQDLLFDLIKVHMDELLNGWIRRWKGISNPEDRLQAFIAFHVGYHIARKREVFICYSELRSLEAEKLRIVVSLRQQYERKLIGILDDGVAESASPCRHDRRGLRHPRHADRGLHVVQASGGCQGGSRRDLYRHGPPRVGEGGEPDDQHRTSDGRRSDCPDR